jgi:hypothetical protein
MFASLKNLVDLRSARNRGARRAERHTRLELEALDQRVLPSSVPNLAGLTIWSNYHSPTLTIQSVSDQGGGHGTFLGVYQDTLDGVLTRVNGIITLKGMVPVLGASWYDFGLTFSGYKPGAISYSLAGGSGDFCTSLVSGNASDYLNPYGGVAWWEYYGTEWDMVVNTRFNLILEESVTGVDSNIPIP